MWSTFRGAASGRPSIPCAHPAMVDAILANRRPRLHALLPRGRPSIPPEKLLRALLLQVLYSTRSERADGTVGLQPALSVVRRAEHG